jgi:hypothetical protein
MTNRYLLLCNTTFATQKFKISFDKTQANKTNKYLCPLFTQSNTKCARDAHWNCFGWIPSYEDDHMKDYEKSSIYFLIIGIIRKMLINGLDN